MAQFPLPILKNKPKFSLIWLLPVIAFLIVGWILYQDIVNKGPVVDIVFDSAEGIAEGKTKVIFKGLEIGVVEKITLHEDLSKVTVQVHFDLGTENLLKENTLLWLVKPRVSLSGVSGLDTLMTGHYIGIRPGKGNNKREFVALSEPPATEVSDNSLLIKLETDKLGSINIGSQVLYRQVPVGKVQGYQFANNETQVIIDIIIEEKFAHLVKTNSRFWNTSGILVKGDFSGIKVQTESLISMLAGGIAFDQPQDGSEEAPAESGSVYKLYEDFDSAEAGIPISVYFNGGLGIEAEKTKVIVNGTKVGIVKYLQFGDDFDGVIADIMLDPVATKLLAKDSQFWLVTPSLSLTELGNISKVLEGVYIEAQFGKSEETSDYFVAKEQAPFVVESSSGLHLQLKSEKLGGISKGMPVLYKQMQVGEVLGYSLYKDNQSFLIDILIQNKFAYLVNKTSKFWNSSGIEFSGRLTQFKLKTDSLASIVVGGIEFETAKFNLAVPKDGTLFKLFKDYASTKEPNHKKRTDLKIQLTTKTLGSLNKNAPVFYRQIEVGRVSDYQLSKQGDDIIIKVTIDGEYAHLVKKDSRFWNASGINVKAGLSGVAIKTESFASILDGGIAFSSPETSNAKVARTNQRFVLYSDQETAEGRNIPITIDFNDADGLSVGMDIRYQGLTIGKVKDLKFINNAKQVRARAVIDQSAKSFLKDKTQFWLVRPSISLLKIENPETLISKYITLKLGTGAENHHFTALAKSPEKQLVDEKGLVLKLKTHRLGSIKKDNPIYYRQITVGKVIDTELGEDATHVIISILIEPRYKKLISPNTRFWNVSGIQANFGLINGLEIQTESLLALINGGISFATPNDKNLGLAVDKHHIFKLYEKAEEEWLEWNPVIPLVQLK